MEQAGCSKVILICYKAQKLMTQQKRSKIYVSKLENVKAKTLVNLALIMIRNI